MRIVKLGRRGFLQLVGGAIAAPALPRLARAAYPSRPVRVFEEFGVGGTPDLVARLTGQWLSEKLGQPFVVENRAGASGNLATEAVIRSEPDGHTLLLCTAANAINASLYQKLNFDFLRDTAPVAGLLNVPLVLLTNPAFPPQTLADFIAYARANPGKVNLATPGNGTPMHVAGELLKMLTGVDIVEVPYRGPAPAFADLLAGQVQAFIITVPASMGFVRSGRLRALGVASAARVAVLPEVPAIGEVVPGYEAGAWDGMAAPRNTPPEIVETLNRTINAALADPQIRAHFDDLGGEPMPMTPSQFGAFVTAETEKWAKVIKYSGAKAE